MEKVSRILLSDAEKALILQEFGIDVNSDLLDPRLDFVAKRIFTADSMESKTALISFLNAMICLSGKGRITDLTVINTEVPVDDIKYKKSIFDIRAKFSTGEQAIIEVEFRNRGNFKKRGQFLISKAYSSQSLSGKTYADLKKCCFIGILGFTLFPDSEDYYHNYMYRNIHGVPLTDDHNIIFVELTKIAGLLKKPVEELTDAECWALFFRYAADKNNRDVINKILEKKEGIRMAGQILEAISQDEMERMIQDARLIHEVDQRSDREEARREGWQAGRQEGIQTGKQVGWQEGVIQIAKNLKASGLPLELISQNTGISIEELAAL